MRKAYYSDTLLAMKPNPSFALASFADAFVRGTARIVCWANALLIGLIVVQVVLRYGFSQGQVFLEELQWHLFSLAILFGIAFAQLTDAHIRVDVIAARLSEKTRRLWEIFGIVVFILPFVWVVFYHSLDFVAESWRLNEHSNAPSGLPWRWAIKSVIPLGFGLLGIVALAQLLRHVAALVGHKVERL
uniref:TRAP transporter small permease protein n=1 Tax=Candidatus Kentrum eta TaxID=2126337 RepID=A0A450VEN8_9GAMM|nr:MAG: TRAP-type mannitol/chloroaromatic compound transport system, small permease component [Candidatus Kentron sp. H]VFJ97538.1 MAG: TRAP-type mannitol/chloroaromatic compound transport system, small permease component [Candidatus Kentron sp. H]VFK03208.1 MAG: TRAP-type mannitol/chloroaromatic compound transport system, small permease component [Candidatus Kentron sp. H]